MILPIILTVIGLTVFEVMSSVDNAIINAEVLSSTGPKARRWFLSWGIFFAVFVVRGLLPLLIIYVMLPSLGLWGAFTAAFNSDPEVSKAVHEAAPVLLIGGGTFLLMLFLHWLFMEEKRFGVLGERFIARHALWFYAVASGTLAIIVWNAVHTDPLLAFGAVLGSTVFFITQGFKENAKKAEQSLISSGKSDISKLIYLEALDLSFSIDGVLGAFAFTLAVPLILIGNGIGAIVLRQLTVSGIDRIRRYAYLKNGALYSVCGLAIIMLLEAFRFDVPYWVAPAITFTFISYFFWKSVDERKSV